MRLSSATFLTSSAFALAVGLAAPAVAQENPAPGTDQNTSTTTTTDNPDACASLPEGSARDNCISGEVEIESGQAATTRDEIVVTGSRIRRPNLESNVPVTSISVEDLTSQGDVNIGDALNDLPAIRSTFSQANSTRFIGTAGVNLLDLRGLGVERTLVLVNGRRHVTYTPGEFLVDVNTIPTDLIERVDVITGGSSAVYGSDAVAGVINFVLKNDFEGIKLRGQGGISSRGDRGIQSVSLTAGKNFFDDRANVAINLEYVNAEELKFTDRDNLTGAYSGRCQFQLAEFTAGEPQSGDGVPDNQFFCGVRNVGISDGGTIAPGGVGVFAPTSVNYPFSCTNPAILANPTLAARCLFPGTPQGQPRIYQFQPDGTLCEDVPALDFRPFGSGNYIANPNSTCAKGSTLRNTGQLAPALDRYTANILASMEITPALQPFFEAKFARVDAIQEGQPSFFQGTFPGFFGGGRGLRCDNPFLTADNITALQGIGRCSTGSATVIDPATGADITPSLPVGRFNVDFGGRSEVIRRDTWRIVGGVRGDFNDDWNYEVAINYGKLKSRQDQLNDLVLFDGTPDFNNAGFLLATDAVRDPNTGQIVCRINSTDPTQNPAGTADDDAACVPINVFGNGQPSQAALDYVNTTSFVKSRASELNIVGYVNGDLSQLFELPGGPVRFVIGGEYRKEKAFQEADPLSASGSTFFNAFSEFDPKPLKVKEVFGEIELPIAKNIPLFHELTFTAAGRFSDYNTLADKTFAWNLNGTWAPIRDIRFRANYSRSVRVPTLGDLFSSPSQNFAFISDPCDTLFINNGTEFRAANCAALGIPVGFVNADARAFSTGFLSSGNPLLEEEVGKSLTLGAVITPRFMPGFSFTVDYYRIRVNNLISVLSAQQIINACVDLPSTANQFCPLITRNDDFTFADPALTSSGINFAKLEADGIDFEAAYRRTFGNGHRLNVRAIATRALKRNNFIDPSQPDFADRQLSELGDPKWAANASVTYGIGPVDIRYSLNFVGKQTIGAYENYFSVQGRPPQNADSTEEVFYPSRLYHAARVNFNVAKKYDFYVGVDNIFDKKPPFGLLGNEAGNAYDSIGRYLYAGASVEF